MLTSLQYSISLRDFDVENIKIRRLLEDSLSDFKFSYWTVPPEVPSDVVRMAGQTSHGHSLLQFSNKVAYLITNFDNNYSHEPDKCMSYAHEKLTNLTEALGKLKTNVVSNGVIAQYVYDVIKEPLSRLRKKIICLNTGASPLHSLSTRFTIIHKEKYYINVELTSLSLANSQNCALGVKLDINDKFGIENKGMTTRLSDIFELAAIQEQLDQEMIIRLLDEGRFELNE